jgi:hypothetical protein
VPWVHRQLASSTMGVFLEVQLLPPVPVHVFQLILGLLSAVRLPTCWARAALRSESVARARDVCILTVSWSCLSNVDSLASGQAPFITMGSTSCVVCHTRRVYPYDHVLLPNVEQVPARAALRWPHLLQGAYGSSGSPTGISVMRLYEAQSNVG